MRTAFYWWAWWTEVMLPQRLWDGWYWAMGCNLVTWPMPLDRPSLKSTLAPTFRYSGCLMNLKRTTAFSPVLSSSCKT